jgi:hypothetical protein
MRLKRIASIKETYPSLRNKVQNKSVEIAAQKMIISMNPL